MYLTKKPKRHFIFSLLLLTISTCSLAAADFRVEAYTSENNNGYFKLEWNASEDATVIVEQARDSNFTQPKIIYKGIDKATFISGLENGTYYYRIKEEKGSWSKSYQVLVRHQSLKLAYTLFTIGAVVFLLTVGVIYKGMKQTQHE